jgi:DNA-binding NarL/FixJ family response regulator
MVPTSILLIDDHPIFLSGLRHLIEGERDLQIVGEASSIAEAIRQTRLRRPDVLILDLSLRDGNGLDALPELLRVSPDTSVLVLSGLGSENLLPALRRGARGFVSKDTASKHLLSAVRAIRQGKIWAERSIPKELAQDLLVQDQRRRTLEGLTPREQEVLTLVGEGRRNRDISRLLFISENTVKTHICSLLRKLGIEDRVQLALHAARVESQP